VIFDCLINGGECDSAKIFNRKDAKYAKNVALYSLAKSGKEFGQASFLCHYPAKETFVSLRLKTSRSLRLERSGRLEYHL